MSVTLAIILVIWDLSDDPLFSLLLSKDPSYHFLKFLFAVQYLFFLLYDYNFDEFAIACCCSYLCVIVDFLLLITDIVGMVKRWKSRILMRKSSTVTSCGITKIRGLTKHRMKRIRIRKLKIRILLQCRKG